MDANKICSKCSIEKPIIHFPKSRENKDGRKRTKDKISERTKAWAEKNAEKLKKYRKRSKVI